MSRFRVFWLAVAIGAVCLLVAAFALGGAIGGREEAKQIARSLILSDLRQANLNNSNGSSTVFIAIKSDPYSGNYWAAGALGLVGVGALLIAWRLKKRSVGDA